MRINRAEDDSAGWSIANKLNARIAGLTQALQNTAEAKGVLDIAETSLDVIKDRLVEIKRLATQAANGELYGTDERNFIRDAINNQASEINAIVEQAQFNRIALLDGTYNATFQVGERIQDTLNIVIAEDLTVDDTQVSQVTSENVLTAAAPITALTQLNNLDQFSGLQAGDTFDIVVTAGDGTATTTTLTMGGTKGSAATETIGDLLTALNGIANISAVLDAGGNIDVEEIVPTDGNLLDVDINNFSEATGLDGATGTVNFAFQALSGGFTTAFTAGVPINGATLLEDLDQFADLEGGDTITVSLQARDGTTATINYTLPGGTGNPATATVSSLAAAITAGGGVKFQASVAGGQILVEELNLAQSSLNATSSFTEFSAGDAIVPGPPFTFVYSNEGMSTTLLDAGLSPATGATLLNNLNGFGNLHGGDVFSFQITNRAGASQSFNFTLNDVGDGVLSNRTVGELVSALDGQTVGGITLDVSLDGAGNLLILEQNPAQAGFSVSATYAEDDLDITPKQFTDVSFQISDFLPVDDTTGLVIGFGLESFNTTYELTSEIARYLIRNVDDSLDRVVTIMNRIGTFQTQLSNRQSFLSATIQSNSSAKSRIEDADFAKVQSKKIQQEIILQSLNAALTQANFAPRSLLGLLSI